jgi:hypothetical protein
MLRASLFVMSAGLCAALFQVPSAVAGPHHRPMINAQIAVPGTNAVRPVRRIVRPVMPSQPVFIGYPQTVFPFYGLRRPVIFESGAGFAAPVDVNVTLNPVPVVVGIRRAPEAAAVIYRIADGRSGDRVSRHEMRQQRRHQAPSAGVHHLHPDTTAPRVIVVRGGYRD